MLKTDGVTIRFGGLVAVNKVSIHVRKGQITVSSGLTERARPRSLTASAAYISPARAMWSLTGRTSRA